MFKKKPNIKPLAPLRSSDRRKTADQIIKDLNLTIPVEDSASAEDKAAATAEHTSLRNSLLPDTSLSARFTTTQGPDLKQVSGTVYVGSHNGEEQRVLWIKINERMFPTVYTLWHNPGIVPLLHTGSNVIPRLQGGADLMTPGLIGGPPFPEKAKKGAIVAVAGHETPSIPLVVGFCEIDVSALQRAQGVKGHAVQTVHWSGDEIWSWSASGKPGVAPPEHLNGWLKDDQDADELEKKTGELDIQEEEGDASGSVQLKPDDQIKFNPGVSEGVDGEEIAEEEAQVKELTTKEIDSAFRSAFLYGVYHHKSTNPKVTNFGLEFPLRQSFVMANLVQPFLPAFTPQQASQLHIKKTSWKNIKKFIKSLDKEHILKSKDRDGNEVVIVDIDFDDQAILEFKPYRLPKKETTAGTSLGRGGKATEQVDSSDSSIGQQLKIIAVHKPKEKLSSLFEASKQDPRGYYSASEIRDVVTSYIEQEQLVNATNKRLVKLNPVLANAVFDGKGAIDKEVLAKGSVPRDTLIDRVLASCSPYHVMQRNSSSDFGKPKAGAPPKINILLETRSGNKTVTKVSGLETYFIAPQPLADELRKVCAGSTSVERLQGSSPKNPVMEVMVQGPQRDAVIKALEKRGVDKRWIDVVDKTKKKKG